jgi:hypothetical protein
MACPLCKYSHKGSLVRLSCGHNVHPECLRQCAREWECPECREPIGSAQFEDGEWFVGIPSPDGMHCCYKVNSDSKLIPFYKLKSTWYRSNGRLIRHDVVTLRQPISVF